jgi:hypothetical protein
MRCYIFLWFCTKKVQTCETFFSGRYVLYIKNETISYNQGLRKGIMKAKKFMQDDSALSEVLGVVLIIGILVTAFSIVMATNLPQWTKSFEAAHAGEVADEFSELASQIDSIVLVAKLGGEIAAGTTAITMKPGRVPIIGMSPPGSSLELGPDNDQFYITPYVSAAPTPLPGVHDFWVETTTDNFSHANATRVCVDVALDTIRLAAIASSGDLILDNIVTSLSGECQYDKVEITNSSVVNLVFGNYLRLYANTIYIDATSRIDADYLGCFGGAGGRSGTGTGAGDFGYMGSGGGGAGHNGTGGNGGLGGNASGDEYGDGGTFYGGNASFILDFGSGGGGGAYGEGGQGAPHQGQVGGYGGHGGGAVFIDAAQIIIYGIISANGADGAPGSGATQASGGGGGGSGGTITIRGYDINLSSATLSAKGGAGGDGGVSTKGGGYCGGGGGGGAGGRIKIFFDNESRYNASFSGDVCNGGTNGTGGSGKGTVGDPGVPGTDGAPYQNETTYISSTPHYTFGYYESRVFDTGNTTTCYGNITWSGHTDDYTSITVKVRTSIYEEMEGNATLWANCDAVASGQDLTNSNSVFDWHRYIQYRVELSTYDDTTTPVFDFVNITYYSSDPAGGFPVIAESTGMVKYKSGHIYYPKQEIAYEHGAVIKCQREKGEEEGIVIQQPPILITNESGIPTIDVTMIDLTGSNGSYSGTTTTSVENSYVEYDSISTKFHNLSLNISTEYPAVWGKWFNKTLAESGLSTANYNVSVNKTANYVVADFYGDEQHVHLVAVDKTKVGVAMT